MSWNGTVRCGFCGERGHNRRGCPDLLEKVAVDRANGGGVFSRADDRSKAKARPRKCSFCDKQGHNRRGCEAHKSEIQLFTDATLDRRARWVKLVEKHNFVVGSFVRWGRYHNWDRPTDITTAGDLRVGILSNIYWENITGWMFKERESIFGVRVVLNYYPEAVRPYDLLLALHGDDTVTDVIENYYHMGFDFKRVGTTTYELDAVPENYLDRASVEKEVKVWLKTQNARYGVPSVTHGLVKETE